MPVNPAGVALFGDDGREALLATPLSAFRPDGLPAFLGFLRSVHEHGRGRTDAFACRGKNARRMP